MYNEVLANDILDINLSLLSGSELSMKVFCDDDNVYHVKLPHINKNNSLYEYTAHIMGNLLEAPLPDGAFIIFDIVHYEKIIKDINKLYKSTYESKGFTPTHLDKYLDFLNNFVLSGESNHILFGIEYIDSAKDDLTCEEFKEAVKGISNIDNFFSVYAFDFYFNNLDRHIKNILILDDYSLGYLIDHDKIFGGRVLQYIDATVYKCIRNDRNQYLYDVIQEKWQYDIIMQKAHLLAELDNTIICNELNLNKFNLEMADLNKIKNYLLDRKITFLTKCEEFQKVCYENINI